MIHYKSFEIKKGVDFSEITKYLKGTETVQELIEKIEKTGIAFRKGIEYFKLDLPKLFLFAEVEKEEDATFSKKEELLGEYGLFKNTVWLNINDPDMPCTCLHELKHAHQGNSNVNFSLLSPEAENDAEEFAAWAAKEWLSIEYVPKYQLCGEWIQLQLGACLVWGFKEGSMVTFRSPYNGMQYTRQLKKLFWSGELVMV